MEKIDYESLLWLFTNIKHEREELRQPFIQAGNYFATDTYAMIYFSVEKIKLNFQPQDKPRVSKFIVQTKYEPIQINVDEIIQQFIPDMIDETSEEKITIKCGECEKGKVECDYGHEHDCPDCDGEGQISNVSNKPTGKKIPDQDTKFTLREAGFTYSILKKLIDVCKMLNVKTIQKISGTPSTPNIFKAGDVHILLMPFILNDGITWNIKKIKLSNESQ